MANFSRVPRILKGGIVLIDAQTSAVQRVINLQYNPEQISRTLQVQSAGENGGDRAEALRLTGTPVETIKLDAEIDAADQLEFPAQNQAVVESGIHPELAALESLVYPTSAQVADREALADSGTLEIAPMEAPLALFVWSPQRVIPVRITEFSITEEAFDPALNPIRAKVSLGMRVLNVNDLGLKHKGGNLFMVYHQEKERLSSRSQNQVMNKLGINGIG